jgi:hypothetical protein
MDFGNLSQADKYLLYGLLLKRKRSPSQQRKLIAVIRSPRDLDEKIEAVMALGEEPERGSRRGRPRKEAPAAGSQRRSRKGGALVVDVFPELAKLLKKCSLKRRFAFTRVGEYLDAIPLLRRLETRLVVVNENLADDEYPRYFEICRAVQPGIRIIFLGSAPRPLPTDRCFREAARFIPKPISIARLEETVGELFGSDY